MSNRPSHDDPIDPRLEGLLETLRQVPPRSPQAAEAGKVRYLAELEELDLPPAQRWSTRIMGWLPSLQTLQEEKIMSGRKLAIYAAISVFVVVMMLFGGAAATAYAAQSALPGDALYFVKTGLEGARIRLASDAAGQAELHLEFAEERLDEIERLIAQKRYDDIARAAQDLELNIQQAIEAFQIAAQADPQRAADLAVRISQALSRFASALSTMMAQVPDAVRPQVERALSLSIGRSGMDDALEFTGVVESQNPETWVVDGQTIAIMPSTEIKGTIAVGDVVKVHALALQDGSLTALEIELASADDDNDNENANDNDNLNSNDNDNLNSNDNDNLNSNDNDNLNSNDDDNLNSNDNDNQNDNDNDDDNQNSNDDDNQNDNDNNDDNQNN